MDRIEIEAIYENGCLKLPHDLPLKEGQTVTITIQASQQRARRSRAVMTWKGSQKDLDDLILSSDNDPLEAS